MNRLIEKLVGREVEDEYWILSKRNPGNSTSSDFPDDVVLAVVSSGVAYKTNYLDLTIREVEEIKNKDLAGNIFLTSGYAPFQTGQRLSDFYDGFPLKDVNILDYMVKALELDSRDIYQYVELMEEMAVTAPTKAKGDN